MQEDYKKELSEKIFKLMETRKGSIGDAEYNRIAYMVD